MTWFDDLPTAQQNKLKDLLDQPQGRDASHYACGDTGLLAAGVRRDVQQARRRQHFRSRRPAVAGLVRRRDEAGRSRQDRSLR